MIAGGVLGLTRRGFELKQTLFERHKGDRASTRAAIEANHLIPRLADLVLQTSASVPREEDEEEDGYRQRVMRQLQKVAPIKDIEEVSEIYADYAAVAGLEYSMGRWGRRAGWAGAVSLPAIVYLGGVFAWEEMPVSMPLRIVASVLAIAGLTAIALSWLQERQLGDELVDLHEKYESTDNS